MSLRVWLPLNGSLENKGLDDITPVLTGAVAVDNEGKIGKCYKIGTLLGRITIPPAVMRNYTECSVTFWVNILGWQTNWDTFFQAGLGSTPWNNYTFGVLRNQSNHVVFVISDGSTSSQGYYKSSDLALNTWYHLAFTYKAGHCCIYVNGVLFKDYTTTIVPKFSNITYISIGQLGNATSYQTNCKMNDFRIYDHALSPLEVKQISQGLVLHYPLNRNGWGQENLYTGSHDFFGSWVNGSLWTTSSETYKGFTVKQRSSTWGGLAQNIPCSNGDIFTISFYAKVESGGRICSVHRSSLGNVTTGLVVLKGNFISGTDWINATDDGTQWNRYWATLQITSSDITYLQWRIENSVANKTLYVCGMKLEKGSKATPWCPNSADELAISMGLNDNIEYDTSGYGNNGTKVGTFNYNSDTPKYNVSTKIAASASGVKLTNFSIGNIWSMSVWFKYPSQDSSSWKALVILNNNGGDADLQFGNFINCSGNNIQYSANGKYTTGVTFTYGEWHHIVNTYDGTTLKCYLDGVYKTSLNPGQTLSRSNLGIGLKSSAVDFSSVSNSATNAFLSDVRIYATALSAQEVLSLYNNSAYIDNQGNIYGAVYEEA